MAQVLPEGSQERKDIPMASGVLDYFPAALAEVARVSKAGNDKHNPGQPLHWARGKSSDHADTILRHLVDRGLVDPEDGLRHSAKLAWRALALLQEELEAAGVEPGRASRFPSPDVPHQPGESVGYATIDQLRVMNAGIEAVPVNDTYEHQFQHPIVDERVAEGGSR